MKPVFTPASLAEWSGGQWRHGEPESIAGFSIDTRKLHRGDCFVALKTDQADGHAFLADAFRYGASSVLVEREPGEEVFGPCLRVASTHDALGVLASGYRSRLNMHAVAVSGSAGKTTVKELTACVLSRLGETARTHGNWNNELGLPLSLLASDTESQFGVFELGMNHPGELDPLCRILEPQGGVVTNIGPVHIEHFSGLEAIAAEKAAICRHVPEDGYVVLSADEPYRDRLERDAAARVLLVSAHAGRADYTLSWEHEDESIFQIHEASSGANIPCRAVLPGHYFAMNCLMAAAVGRVNGADWDQVVQGLESFQPLPLRWQVSSIGGVTVINDAYNANPLSMREAIRAAVDSRRGRPVWLLLGTMRELGGLSQTEHRDIGAFAAESGAAGMMFVGPESKAMQEGALEAGARPQVVLSREDPASAAPLLHEVLKSGDVLLAKASRSERLENVLEIWKKIVGEPDAEQSETESREKHQAGAAGGSADS